MQVVICVEVYKRLGRSLKLRLEKVSSMLQRKIQERLTNGEVKGKGEVNTIENEDAVMIADDEGFIEKKVLDEGDNGVCMSMGTMKSKQMT